jgi:hypothetical protein
MSSVKLAVQVSKRKLYPSARSHAVYTAIVGELSADGPSEKEAVAKLQVLAERACNVMNATVCMYDLLEPRTLWIAVGDARGWSYQIVRPTKNGPYPGEGHYSSVCVAGGEWSREDCLTRMKAHWSAQNIEPIVAGICALAGWGYAKCQKCLNVTQLTRLPIRCPNPACREELHAATL